MTKKKKPIKKWLTENKVYFEVISLIIFGLASIIVAILSWKSSERQVELSELEHIPLIHVKKEISDSIPILNVYNVGEPAFNVNAESTAIFSVNSIYFFNNITERPAQYLFSLDRYYEYMSTTENTNGKIASLRLNKNAYLETERLKREISELESNKDFYMDGFQLLKLNYEDIEGKSYQKFFMVDRRGTEISNIKFDSIYDRFAINGEYLNMEELRKLKAEETFDRIPMENTTYQEPIKAKVIHFYEIKRGE